MESYIKPNIVTPTGLAYDPQSTNLYFSSSSEGTIKSYNFSTSQTEIIQDDIINAKGIVCNNNGELYFLYPNNSGNKEIIAKNSITGAYSIVFRNNTEFNTGVKNENGEDIKILNGNNFVTNANGITFDSCGNLYFTCLETGLIGQIETSGRMHTLWRTPDQSTIYAYNTYAKLTDKPYDIKVGKKNKYNYLYYTNYGRNEIMEVLIPDTKSSNYDSNLNYIFTTYVNDTLVYAYERKEIGNMMNTYFNPKVIQTDLLNGPKGIIFDSDGNLYCANDASGGFITKKKSTTNTVTILCNNLGAPNFLEMVEQQVVCSCSNNITIIDSISGNILRILNDQHLTNITNIIFNDISNINNNVSDIAWCCDNLSIYKFNAENQQITKVYDYDSNIGIGPYDIAFGGEGHIYGTFFNNNNNIGTICGFVELSNGIFAKVPLFSSNVYGAPFGITIDTDNNIYCSYYTVKKILKFSINPEDEEQNYTETIFFDFKLPFNVNNNNQTQLLFNPGTLKQDNEGCIYCLNNGNYFLNKTRDINSVISIILKFNKDGNILFSYYTTSMKLFNFSLNVFGDIYGVCKPTIDAIPTDHLIKLLPSNTDKILDSSGNFYWIKSDIIDLCSTIIVKDPEYLTREPIVNYADIGPNYYPVRPQTISPVEDTISVINLLNPRGITINNITGQIYITSLNTVGIFTTTSYVKLVDAISNPTGITVDGDGNVYVCNYNRNNIIKLNFYDMSPTVFIPYVRNPINLVIGKNYKEWQSGDSTSWITGLFYNNKDHTYYHTTRAATQNFHKIEYLYCLNRGNTLYQYAINNSGITDSYNYGMPGVDYRLPIGIGIVNLGNNIVENINSICSSKTNKIYFAQNKNNTVISYDFGEQYYKLPYWFFMDLNKLRNYTEHVRFTKQTYGNNKMFVASGLNDPVGIVCDYDGNLYICDSIESNYISDHKIYVVDTQGYTEVFVTKYDIQNSISNLIVTKLGPIDTDIQNNIYCVVNGNVIIKITKDKVITKLIDMNFKINYFKIGDSKVNLTVSDKSPWGSNIPYHHYIFSIFVSDTIKGYIYRINSNLTIDTIYKPIINSPVGITFYGSKLIFTNNDDGELCCFNYTENKITGNPYKYDTATFTSNIVNPTALFTYTSPVNNTKFLFWTNGLDRTKIPMPDTIGNTYRTQQPIGCLVNGTSPTTMNFSNKDSIAHYGLYVKTNASSNTIIELYYTLYYKSQIVRCLIETLNNSFNIIEERIILTSSNGLSNPAGITVDLNNNIYVTNFTNNTIIKYKYYNNTWTQDISIIFDNASFSGPFSIVFDNNYKFLYCSYYNNSSIVKYNEQGVVVGEYYAYEGLGPRCLTFSELGELFCTFQNSSMIIKI